MNQPTFHSKDLRKGRSSLTGQAYAITKCVEGRRPVLLGVRPSGSEPAQVIVDALKFRHEQGVWACHGYVVMPDHVHFVIRQLTGSLANSMASFSKFTSLRINQLLEEEGSFWQQGFYDHGLRGERSQDAYLAYIWQNPVRAGLVSSPEEWPYQAIHPKW
jgi:putative transposase